MEVTGFPSFIPLLSWSCIQAHGMHGHWYDINVIHVPWKQVCIMYIPWKEINDTGDPQFWTDTPTVLREWSQLESCDYSLKTVGVSVQNWGSTLSLISLQSIYIIHTCFHGTLFIWYAWVWSQFWSLKSIHQHSDYCKWYIIRWCYELPCLQRVLDIMQWRGI